MRRPWAVLLSAVLVLSIGIGTLEATAGRHRHKAKVVYRSAAKAIGSNDAQFVTRSCPGGYRAISVSGDTSGIAYSNGYELTRSDGTAWWINEGTPSVVRVRVACLKVRTSARRASSTGSNRRELEQKREALLRQMD